MSAAGLFGVFVASVTLGTLVGFTLSWWSGTKLRRTMRDFDANPRYGPKGPPPWPRGR